MEQTIQLSLFEFLDFDYQLERPCETELRRSSIIRYLVKAKWDNTLEMVLRGVCTAVSTFTLIMVTTIRTLDPLVQEQTVNSTVIRRRKFGTRIIAENNRTMYINWRLDEQDKLITGDTTVVEMKSSFK